MPHSCDQEPWPNGTRVARIRVARPTDRLQDVLTFYRDAVGLEVIGSFEDHDGYDGVMLGLPDWTFHLEFTQLKAGSPGPAPSRDNLLVLYFDEQDDIDRVAARLQAHGHEPVQPENPYWIGRSLTFEDPDGWRLVLSRIPGR